MESNTIIIKSLEDKIAELAKTVADQKIEIVKKDEVIFNLRYEAEIGFEFTEHLREMMSKMEPLVLPYETVGDQLKADLIIENWEKITLSDIDLMLELINKKP